MYRECVACRNGKLFRNSDATCIDKSKCPVRLASSSSSRRAIKMKVCVVMDNYCLPNVAVVLTASFYHLPALPCACACACACAISFLGACILQASLAVYAPRQYFSTCEPAFYCENNVKSTTQKPCVCPYDHRGCSKCFYGPQELQPAGPVCSRCAPFKYLVRHAGTGKSPTTKVCVKAVSDSLALHVCSVLGSRRCMCAQASTCGNLRPSTHIPSFARHGQRCTCCTLLGSGNA